MTQEEREALAARLQRELLVRFKGVNKDAYTAAKVNPATWANAVNGRSMKVQKVIQIVTNLWPETHGDWTKIPDDDAPATLNTAEMMRELIALRREVELLKRDRKSADDLLGAEHEAG